MWVAVTFYYIAVRIKMEADASAELLAHQGNYQGAAKVRMNLRLHR